MLVVLLKQANKKNERAIAPDFEEGQIFTVAVRGTYTRYGFDRRSDGEKAVRVLVS